MNSAHADDSELIARCGNGDEQAFELLYQRYRLQLYSYLNKLVPGRADIVDDLYQQTWIRVLDSLARYREQKHFLSWLFRIAHNLAMDHFRQQAKHETVELDEKASVTENPPWVDTDRQELAAALGKAVEELPREQREVFLLRQQGIPFKEIAAVQEVGLNTALGRMHYAVNSLRQLLANWR